MTATYSSLNLVLLGPPGSGKSTQGQSLADSYQLPLISTRDMLRSEVERGTALGGQIAASMERGELVPDRTVVAMMLERLDRDDCWRGFILDGFPRNVDQAILLDGILAELGRSIERVVLLEVPEEQGMARLVAGGEPCEAYELDGVTGVTDAAGLSANPQEVIRERFRIWRENAPLLMEFYGHRGLLLRVDGSRSEAEVSDAVMQAVGAPVGA